MPISIIAVALLFFLVVAAVLLPSASSQPQPRGFYINCGSGKDLQIGSTKWIQDDGFVAVGNSSEINNELGVLPVLSTLRYFPDETARKYCYQLPVVRGTRYLVRTTYFYGGFDGGVEPPVFDQIVDGTRWSAVNTSDDYRRGMSTYFEVLVRAQGKTVSVCLARRPDTGSSPFISSLEVVDLADSMYNATDFGRFALGTVARSRFGSKGGILSYPDDPYNRYWAPFADDANPAVECHSPISPDDFWNLPPATALRSGVTASRGKNLTVRWPPADLPAATYHVALYFQDSRTASPFSWRVFDVAVNGQVFFRGLNASAAGVMVYSSMMRLAGKTEILLTPDETSPVGPMINAGEIYMVLPLGGRTATRDAVAMENLAGSLTNPPPDWAGDPCLPHNNSWTGVECSKEHPVRVLSLDLRNHSLSGSLPDSLGNLTAVKTIYLSGNKLSGSIPDLSGMRTLTALHLDGNQFSGMINPKMAKLIYLKELYLNNNNLTGQIPIGLKNKHGLDLRTEGNKFG